MLHNTVESHQNPMLYNILELHNSLMFQYNIVQKSTITCFTVSQVLLKHLNGASIQDNSLLRYTLYTPSVQDLHLPLRFLLQRQSYAFIQGYTLELSISYD